jgi:hypothetical protein
MNEKSSKATKILIIVVLFVGVVIAARWGNETTRGIVLLLLAACVPLYLLKRMLFRWRAQRTVGKIVHYPQVGRTPSMDIVFTTLDGKQIRTNVTIPVKKIGAELTIYYDPKQPTRVSYPLGCLSYSLFGVVFFLFFFLGISFFL